MPFAQIMLTAVAALALIAAVATVVGIRRISARVPHLKVVTGRVATLATSIAHLRSSIVTTTDVDVPFAVDGQTYRCRTLKLFGGNKHMPVPKVLPQMPPGSEVGVYYDPANPKRCALMLDKPSYAVAIWSAAFGVFCGAMAATQFN